MANARRQPFFSSGDFVVRKSFTMQGVDYKPGDEFDWTKLGLEERKAESMFNAHFIMLKPVEVKSSKIKATDPKKKKPVDEDDEEDEVIEDTSAQDKKDAKAKRAKDRAAARKKGK